MKGIGCGMTGMALAWGDGILHKESLPTLSFFLSFFSLLPHTTTCFPVSLFRKVIEASLLSSPDLRARRSLAGSPCPDRRARRSLARRSSPDLCARRSLAGSPCPDRRARRSLAGSPCPDRRAHRSLAVLVLVLSATWSLAALVPLHFVASIHKLSK